MKDEFLVDTNILEYAFDKSDPSKRNKSRELVESVFRGEEMAAVSNQILGEFYNVVTKKIKNPISENEAFLIITAILDSDNWIKIDYTSKSVKNAVKISAEFGIN